MSRTRRVLLVARHAPVAVEGVCYGRSDVPVVGTSEENADVLARSYPESAPPDVVWSSPSARCRDVAHALARRWSAAARVDERLSEVDFGAWEGRTYREVEAMDRDGYARWMRDWQEIAPPRGERPRDLERRAQSWLDALDLGASHALVAHAGFVRALHVIVSRIDWIRAMGIAVPHLAWQQVELGSR